MTALNVEELRRNPLWVPITVDQYHEMIAQGILREGEPIELLDGVLIRNDRSKNGENPITVGHHHAYAVDQLSELNQQLKPHGCFMRTQQPVTIAPDSEPEPDGAIVRGSSTDYREAHPAVADVLCVFEVSDSSLHQDGTTKQRIYAEAEIPQYVLINLVDRVVEVRTNPSPAEGRYAATTTLKKGQTFTIHMPDGADLIATVENLLP